MLDLFININIKDEQLRTLHIDLTSAVSVYCEMLVNVRNKVNNDISDAFIDGLNTGLAIHEQIDLTKAVDVISLPLNAWLFYLAFSTPYKGDTLTSSLKSCFDVTKCQKGIAGFIEFITDGCEALLKVYRHYTYGEALGGGLFPEIDDLVVRVQHELEKFRNGGDFDWDNAVILFQLERDLNTMLAKVPNNNEFVGYKRQVMLLLSNIKPFVDKMQRSNIIITVCDWNQRDYYLLGRLVSESQFYCLL